mgnify:CR=1 FL=1
MLFYFSVDWGSVVAIFLRKLDLLRVGKLYLSMLSFVLAGFKRGDVGVLPVEEIVHDRVESAGERIRDQQREEEASL